jgi:hypothetical protein
MLVSLTFEPSRGTCSGCGITTKIITFGVLAEGQNGVIDPLCSICLFGSEGLVASVPMQPLAPGPASRRKGLQKARRRSLKQEVEVAEMFGARTQPGSGNQAGAKGDARKKGELRLEMKYTTGDSYSLRLDDLQKIAGEAGIGERPIMVLDYLEQGSRKLRDRFAILNAADLKELLDAPRNNR